jgi:hypothetical protein
MNGIWHDKSRKRKNANSKYRYLVCHLILATTGLDVMHGVHASEQHLFNTGYSKAEVEEIEDSLDFAQHSLLRADSVSLMRNNNNVHVPLILPVQEEEEDDSILEADVGPINLLVNYNGQHPFEIYKKEHDPEGYNRYLKKMTFPSDTPIPSLRPSTLTPTTSPTPPPITRQPIRITFEVSTLQEQKKNATVVSSEIIDVLIDEVLPELGHRWSNLLKVAPVMDPIPIPEGVCNNLFPHIPSSIFEKGVSSSDLVIFVSAHEQLENGRNFCKGRTLAKANFCNLDQFDRPLVGYINLCLKNVDVDVKLDESGSISAKVLPHSKSSMLDVLMHEVGHICGMNDEFFKYFRDGESGEPLTRRPFQKVTSTCVDGSQREVELADSNTLRLTETVDANGGDHFYYEIVTPQVTAVVRNQFGCQTLQGARLEQQPTKKKSCTGAHWDERLFFTEAMGPIYTEGSSMLSPLTLALMADTGFYEVNFESSYIQNSPFGMGAGCDFVNKDCVDRSTNSVPDSFKPFFCDSVSRFDDSGIDKSTQTQCNPAHTHVAFCDLFDFSNGVPDGFPQPDVSRVNHFSNPNIGSLFSRGDFCPIVNLHSVNCKIPSDSSHDKMFLNQEYGENSNCFDTSFAHPIDGEINQAVCLRATCNKQEGNVDVYISNKVIKCLKDGDTHKYPGDPFRTFKCPPLSSICPDIICPAMCSGKGICNYELPIPKCECFDIHNTSPGCFENDNNNTEKEKIDVDNFSYETLIINGGQKKSLQTLTFLLLLTRIIID